MRMNGLLSPSNLCRVVVLGLIMMNVGCNTTNGWVWNRSGMRQYQRGHYAQARHRFARAISQDPCNPDYRHNLAMAIQKQGDPGVCEKILRYNLTINAMHQPTYHSLAQLLVTEGRTAEAQDLVTGWVATQPYVPEANIEMAWLQKETGDYAGAEQSLQNALKADPTHAIALAHMGQLYQTSGRADQAAAYYQRSLASNWDQPEVQSRLATLSDPGTMSRSAMMRTSGNATMMASAPMMSDDSMLVNSGFISSDPMMASVPTFVPPAVASNAPFGSDPEAVALEDLRTNQLPRSRRRGRDNQSMMTAYPLPNFDSPATAWVPSANPGQPSMAFQPPTVATATMMPPQIADNSYSTLPQVGGTQFLPPQADPAHFYETNPTMTAALPVVDPH